MITCFIDYGIHASEINRGDLDTYDGAASDKINFNEISRLKVIYERKAIHC